MIDFQEVMQRIKEILIVQTKKEKILDRDIADTLKLDPQYYAVIKRRKKIPYEKLAYFCKENRISMNWILLEQKPQNLK
ncbi:MAG: hypothetical protein J7J02_05405 [Sulfurovum sp.]|nr:hypothetical protein [Sulfurovum sp.]